MKRGKREENIRNGGRDGWGCMQMWVCGRGGECGGEGSGPCCAASKETVMTYIRVCLVIVHELRS
jgi:hypothetical protein